MKKLGWEAPALGGSLQNGVQLLAHRVPVDMVPEGLHVLGPQVLVVDVVGVLPDVQDHQHAETRV